MSCIRPPAPFLETAVTLGLGYPLGPLAMGDRWGPTNVLEVLFNTYTLTDVGCGIQMS